MNNINWQDLYTKKVQKRQPLRGGSQGDARKNSFADQFLSDSTRGYPSKEPPSYNHRTAPQNSMPAPASIPETPKQETYYRYQAPNTPGQQAYQSYASPQKDARTGNEYSYGSQNFGAEQSYQSKWRFLNLRSKKQTGDLYKNILNANRKKDAKSFCFTSSLPKEGVTTILANLLDYVRQQGTSKRVIVIDANVNHPNLNAVFGLPANCQGLKDVMARRVDLQSALIPVGPGFRILCCGGGQQYDQRNFEPEEFYKLLRDCRQFADFIFVDCPPILSSPDALSIAPSADISFLVLQAVKVRRQVAEKSLSALHNNECEIGGVILNRVQQVIPSWLYRFI